jgi:hypothetical protein
MSNDAASRARLATAERMAREIVAIADDASRDEVKHIHTTESKKTAGSRESIGRDKLRIEVRMWLMARLAPHLYGAPRPKEQEPDPPLNLIIHTEQPRPDRGPGETGTGARNEPDH